MSLLRLRRLLRGSDTRRAAATVCVKGSLRPCARLPRLPSGVDQAGPSVAIGPSRYPRTLDDSRQDSWALPSASNLPLLGSPSPLTKELLSLQSARRPPKTCHSSNCGKS